MFDNLSTIAIWHGAIPYRGVLSCALGVFIAALTSTH